MRFSRVLLIAILASLCAALARARIEGAGDAAGLEADTLHSLQDKYMHDTTQHYIEHAQDHTEQNVGVESDELAERFDAMHHEPSLLQLGHLPPLPIALDVAHHSPEHMPSLADMNEHHVQSFAEAAAAQSAESNAAAAVDMSAEAELEAQLERLANKQGKVDRAAAEAQMEAQGKNLLSWFWGKRPHKKWLPHIKQHAHDNKPENSPWLPTRINTNSKSKNARAKASVNTGKPLRNVNRASQAAMAHPELLKQNSYQRFGEPWRDVLDPNRPKATVRPLPRPAASQASQNIVEWWKERTAHGKPRYVHPNFDFLNYKGQHKFVERADKFDALDTLCHDQSKYDLEKCLKPAWEAVGCNAVGTLYPGAASAAAHWNSLNWKQVRAEMARLAKEDVPEGQLNGECRGKRFEVFYYDDGAKNNNGFSYTNEKDAAKACQSIGAVLASPLQMKQAWLGGAQWCSCGFTNDGKASYPMQAARVGCGQTVGVVTECKFGGAACWGVKPSQSSPYGPKSAPYNSDKNQWYENAWKELDEKCAVKGAPYDLNECIIPAWLRTGCTELGLSFPRDSSASILQVLQGLPWFELKAYLAKLHATDRVSCIDKFHSLDAECDKPRGPHLLKSCLRAAWRLSGCDETGWMYPGTISSALDWWNSQPWSLVKRDFAEWARLDNPSDTRWGGCSARKEVFFFDPGHKEYDAAGDAGNAYSYLSAPDAAKACELIGARLATPHELSLAWSHGADWCASGFLSDGSTSFPIQNPREGCGVDPGIQGCCRAGGAVCYGVKPALNTPGVWPFNSQRWSGYRAWAVSDWSSCTHKCDAGNQTRSVQCLMFPENQPTLNPHICNTVSNRPSEWQVCNSQPCLFHWRTSNWTTCSSSCGGGEQTRKVRCISHEGVQFPWDQCQIHAGPQPVPKQACNTQPCVTFAWKVPKWGQCSKECGGGVQTRDVVCFGSDEKIYKDKRCHFAGPKPSLKRECNKHQCPTWEWKPSEWSTCSLSCGGGVQQRNVVCIGSHGKPAPADLETKLCKTPRPATQQACNSAACPAMSWSVTSWSKCSAVCGGGSQVRAVSCVSAGGKQASDEACASQGPKPAVEQSCNELPCVDYVWDSERWSACSLSCGGGVQHRKVLCAGSDGTLAPDDMCARNAPKIISERPCNTQSCLSLQWFKHPFTPCSASCGGGVKTREVLCVASDNSTRALDACVAVLGRMPSTSRGCNTQSCITYSWSAGDWNECPQSCGGAVQQRSIKCLASNGTYVDDANCASAGKKPESERPCNSQKCTTFGWSVGAWSSCSVICGTGSQTRSVGCIGSDGVEQLDSACAVAGSKPITSQTCNTNPCVTYAWQRSTWSDCSASCGGGFRTRGVDCVGSDGVKVPDSQCQLNTNSTASKKPRTSSECNTHQCISLQWIASPWDQCSQSCAGGVQTRNIVCKGSDGTARDDSQCLVVASKPSSTRTCNTQQCLTYEWKTGPWDSCSRSCGGGESTRKVWCEASNGARTFNNTGCTGDKPIRKQACNNQLCEQGGGWVADKWGACSAKCGGGTQSRDVKCTITNSDSGCALAGSAPVSLRACNTQPCVTYEWKTGNWDDCSRSCGNGVQTRDVSCVGSDGTSNNPAQLCPDAKPASDRVCNTQKCVSYYWKAGEWGTCNAPCGSGVQERPVVCQGSDGQQYAHSACSLQGAPPASRRPCNTDPCVAYEWNIGAFSDCSRTCGNGEQTRSVTCQTIAGKPMADELCNEVGPKAVTRQSCNTQACVGLFWFAGEWSDCSATCNGGIVTREVSCRGTDGEAKPDEQCRILYGKKPVAVKPCNTAPCGNFSYALTPYWTTCTASCGGGQQQRLVQCIGPDGNVWDDKFCEAAGSARPTSPTQACNTRTCSGVYWSLTAWSPCSKRCGGGEQVRQRVCKRTADDLEVSSTVCQALSDPPGPLTQTCNAHKCLTAQWAADEWDDCSVSCGGGEQRRRVFCLNELGREVSSRACHEQPRPANRQVCNLQECAAGAASWEVGAWGVCSASCGGGMQARSVNCRNSTADPDCSAVGPMPVSVRPCATRACLSYNWEVSPWSACSASCGTNGVQYRDVKCKASDGGFAPAAECESAAGIRPESTQPCSGDACPVYSWSFTAWSQCSKSCGIGSQTRQVGCVNQDGKPVARELCGQNGIRPKEHRLCNTYDCQAPYQWDVSKWTHCSKHCEGGVRHRQVKCINSKSKQVNDVACAISLNLAKPTVKEACNTHACIKYSWTLADWGKCSKWCGGGEQTRAVTCVGSDDKKYPDRHCAVVAGEKASTARACNTLPCVAGTWQAEPIWSDCSAGCGGGNRTRQVACVGSDGTILPDDACSAQPKLASVEKCNTHKCLTFAWFVGPFGKCSKACGAGEKARQVVCVGSDGKPAADANCAFSGTKAPSIVPCNTAACSSFQWTTSPWSDCTLSCGRGTQQRRVRCVNKLSGKKAPDAACAAQAKPSEGQDCNVQACVSYSWHVTAWSTCSKECDGGAQSRTVECRGSDGKVYPDGACAQVQKKPLAKRVCHSESCSDPNLYTWAVTRWTRCSAVCSGGQQTRRVSCVRLSTGAPADISKCVGKTGKPAPVSDRVCNTHQCTAFRWKSVTRWSKCNEGKQQRKIACFNGFGKREDDGACAGVGHKPETSRECPTPAEKRRLAEAARKEAARVAGLDADEKAAEARAANRPSDEQLAQERKQKESAANLDDAIRRAAVASGDDPEEAVKRSRENKDDDVGPENWLKRREEKRLADTLKYGDGGSCPVCSAADLEDMNKPKCTNPDPNNPWSSFDPSEPSTPKPVEQRDREERDDQHWANGVLKPEFAPDARAPDNLPEPLPVDAETVDQAERQFVMNTASASHQLTEEQLLKLFPVTPTEQ